MSTTPTGTTGGDYCPACGSAGMRGRTHACVPASAPISAEDLTQAYFAVDPYAATIADILLRLVALERRDTPDESSACDCNAAGIMQDLDSAYADLDKVKAERDAAIARAETAEGELAEEIAIRECVSADRDRITVERDEANGLIEAARNLYNCAERERDAERERAGRLEAALRDVGKMAVHAWEANVDTQTTERIRHAVGAALALPASDTKENGDE